MNKSAIKGFSVRARRKLIEDISQKAYALGIKDTGKYDEIEEFEGGFRIKDAVNQIVYPMTAKKDREKLISEINRKGFEQVIEEVAYTWFNRIIAIRFMEVNEYLPVRVRILSSETPGKIEPDVLTNIYDYVEELELDGAKVFDLKENHKDEELFKYVFVRECNNLGKLMPQVFEAIGDFTELLLPDQLLVNGSVIRDLIDSIPENDYLYQVEIIGWLYQYYNEEKKNEVINIYKGVVKKNDIPAATQLFTTKWVVQYMVDNSLGRYWIERNPESKLGENLDFLIKENIEMVNEDLSPENIKFLDPCMGSGHILVYAFEVFMKIYEERGYRTRDAAELIISKNLHGLDIDDRAGQLATFSLMMSARKYDRRIFTKNVKPVVYSIKESEGLRCFEEGSEQIVLNDIHKETANYLIDIFRDAKDFGSIIDISDRDYDGLQEYISTLRNNGFDNLFTANWYSSISSIVPHLANQAHVLSQKYDVVVTNPPYLNKMNSNLKEFVKKHYKDYSSDLFSIFMYRNLGFLKADGYSAYMTPFVWMFIKSYEKLRQYIIENKNIISLIQLEYSAFEEATVPICTFVIKNSNELKEGYYLKLSEFTGGMDVQMEKVKEALSADVCNYRYNVCKSIFTKIPGMPISFWNSEELLGLYDYPLIGTKFSAKEGVGTRNDNEFLKMHWEVDVSRISRKSRWILTDKAGMYRKWYLGFTYVMDWEDDGRRIKNYRNPDGSLRSRPQNVQYLFKQGISWGKVGSGSTSFRLRPSGYGFNDAAPTLFGQNELPLLAALNSNVFEALLKIRGETINMTCGVIEELPLLGYVDDVKTLEDIVSKCIMLSKQDWDFKETSYDFIQNPLITYQREAGTIISAVSNFLDNASGQTQLMRKYEEELNEILIKAYKLEGVISSRVEEKNVTLFRYTELEVVKEFISYFVGCLMGRYSLDEEGLVHAGGQFDFSRYSKFTPVEDNVILISEDEYFDRDIISQLTDFIKETFNDENLEENLKYIASVLNPKSKETSRKTIRNYFVKDFYKDHCKMYKKRPIYWMIDSGKQNGIKALFYMHRYDKSTIARFRTDYLHEIQRYYENDIELTEKTNDKKRVDKLKKKLQEVTEFDKVVAHIAHQQIEFDLDDGVDHNYELFQGIEVPQGDGQKPLKADLLAKRM